MATLSQLTAQGRRLQNERNRADKRQWVQDRRARTRHLIELGGLVQKAGLVETTGDDRAVLLGAMLDLARQLDSGQKPYLLEQWRRQGLDAFARDAPKHEGQPEKQRGGG